MNELPHLAKPKDGPAPRWFHIAVAASMVISAVAALVGSLLTSRTMSALVEQNAKLVRAGSTPLLEFSHGNAREEDGSSYLEFGVKNVGSGMARVVWFELRVDDKPMVNMTAAIQALAPNVDVNYAFFSSPVARRLFAPNAGIRLFGWSPPATDQPEIMKAWKALDAARFTRIKVEACYCSVFDECWISSLNGDVPRPTPACVSDGRVSLQG